MTHDVADIRYMIWIEKDVDADRDRDRSVCIDTYRYA